jgi:adenylate kinase
MAPITDSTVSDLKDLVHKLEVRVHQLEERLGDGGKKPKRLSDSMRMILIGPPGAGEPRSFKNTNSTNADTVFCREGHASATNQEQILRLSFGQHSSKNPEKIDR